MKTYTAREWLEKTLPTRGTWRSKTWDSGDVDIWHHFDDRCEGTLYANGIAAGPVVSPDEGDFGPTISRSTAIDLMVSAIEAGEVGEKTSTHDSIAIAAFDPQRQSDFNRGVRAACGYIAAGVKGAFLSRVEACRVMFLGEMTNEQAQAAYDEQTDAERELTPVSNGQIVPVDCASLPAPMPASKPNEQESALWINSYILFIGQQGVNAHTAASWATEAVEHYSKWKSQPQKGL